MVSNLNVIERNNVVPGAVDDTYHVGTVHHCGKEVLTHTTVLTAAQLHAISATPVDVLPDRLIPGSIQAAVLGIYYSKEAGAYTSGAALTLNYKDSGNTLVATIPVGRVRSNTAVTGWATMPAMSGTPSSFTLPTEGIDANAASNFHGGGGDLSITVRYVEVV